MMSSNDVREVSFAKSMSGYNRDEVDNFLDEVESDYQKYEAYVQSLQEKVSALTNEVNEYKESSSSLQNVLVSAQQLADKIVSDAKAEAEAIKAQAAKAAEEATGEAKSMLENFDKKLADKRADAEKQLQADLAKSKKEQEALKLVTDEIIRKQQAAFDRLKIEVAQFKKEIIAKYKDQLELISKLPEDIVMDAQRVAQAIEYEFAKEEEAEPETVQEHATEEAPVEEAPVEEETKQTPEEILRIDPDEVEKEMNEGGFVISIDDAEEEEPEEDLGFSNAFFSQSK